jgi:hypothetical protein
MVNVLAKAPLVVKFPARVRALVPLFTPVPPLAGDNVPVQPAVIDVARSSAVDGEPPRVNVTLVSSIFVRVAPVMS